MDRVDWIAEVLDYDLWANRLWLSTVLNIGNPEERAVFGHILSASRIWLLRISGESPTAMPVVTLQDESLSETHSGFLLALKSVPLEKGIEYRRTTGELLQVDFGTILTHVLNHGTYHRGQLRGMMGSRGESGFPETDFVRFALEKG